jgi:hypothetical protein
MPTPTDLVTDLPADFEVFGQAVDTSMADLKGGTSGQILSKASNTDMDFTWITNDVGDITNIAVTSPITGGGSSGSVTIGVSAASTSASGVVQLSDSTSTTSSVLASTPTATKSAYDLATTANTAAGTAQTTANAAIPKSTVTTAGDVIYATGSAAVTRLGIGTAGQVLTVNGGGTAPSWTTLATANAVGVSLTKSAAQTIATSAQTAVTWDGEVFDTNSFHDNVTNNSRVTIPSGKAGKYLITTMINYVNGGGSIRSLNIYKNGVASNDVAFPNNAVSNCVAVHSVVMDLAVADYIQIFTLQNSGGNLNVAATSGGSSTSCQVMFLGA